MKILIGPDSLKGSVSASQFCTIAEKVIHKHWPNDQVIALPLADGGEGTVEALVQGCKGNLVECEVTNPLGEKIMAQYGLLEDDTVAILEMAAASGLSLVPTNKRNPMNTTTYGTGQLIQDAINRGCKKIIIAIGGSATNDGGLGMMQALGFKCLNASDRPVAYGGQGLLELTRIIPPNAPPFKELDIQIACDVNNPLYGPNGAAHIYSRQKGANDSMIDILDEGLKNLSRVILSSLNIDVSTLAGGGAAGGLGAGLYASIGGTLLPGFEIIKRLTHLDKILDSGIDLLITGEGEMNLQSLNGKLPIELAKYAHSKGIPSIALVGSRNITLEMLKDTGLIAVVPIVNKPMSLEQAMEDGQPLIKEALFHTLSMLHSMRR